jgi:hypothetical protein
MTPLHRGIAIAVHITFLVVALGLVVRRRWKLSCFFAAYIAFVLVINPMVVWWPDRFFRRWFFLVIQPAMDVLKFGIALEVAWRTFRPFPGTRSTSLRIVLAVLGATAIFAAFVPMVADIREWAVVSGQLFPRIKTGAIWLMAATLVLARWYHVPVHPFHTALLTTFVSYLGLLSVELWLWNGGRGLLGGDLALLNTVDAAADLVTATCWSYCAWRPDNAMVLAHRQTLRTLETAIAPAGSAS